MDITKEIRAICVELKGDFLNILTLLLKTLEIIEELEITEEERKAFQLYIDGFYSNLSQAETLLIDEEKSFATQSPDIQLKAMNDLISKMTFICSDAHFALEEDDEDEIYEASLQLLEKFKKKQLLLAFLPQVEKWSATVYELYLSAKELLNPFIQKRMFAMVKNQPIELNEIELKSQLDPLLLTIEKIKKIWDEAEPCEKIGEEKIAYHLQLIERRWRDLCFRALPFLYQISQCWLNQCIASRDLLEERILFLKKNLSKLGCDDSPFDRIKENIKKLEKQKDNLKEEKPSLSYFDYFYLPNFIKIPWLTSSSAEIEMVQSHSKKSQ